MRDLSSRCLGIVMSSSIIGLALKMRQLRTGKNALNSGAKVLGGEAIRQNARRSAADPELIDLDGRSCMRLCRNSGNNRHADGDGFFGT